MPVTKPVKLRAISYLQDKAHLYKYHPTVVQTIKFSHSENKRPLSTYIISAVRFLVSLFCIYYYLNHIQGSISEKVSQKIFYLILIVFGIRDKKREIHF
jgi:hypothetical protein